MAGTSTEQHSGCVLVTGAGSGIGAAIAGRLAATGRPIALLGRRPDALATVAATIIKAGGRAVDLPCDVRDAAQVQTAVQQASERLGDVGGLVAAAGTMPVAPMTTADPADWQRMLEVNVLGVLHAVHAVLPGMLERGRGHLVFIGSLAGRVLFPDATVYCATKSAVDVIAEGLRSELVRRRREDDNRIRVTLLAPGAVDTPLPESIADDEARAATTAWYGGMDGILQPDDVAEAARWAMDAPEHVSINEVVVRPTSMAR